MLKPFELWPHSYVHIWQQLPAIDGLNWQPLNSIMTNVLLICEQQQRQHEKKNTHTHLFHVAKYNEYFFQTSKIKDVNSQLI